MRIGCSTGGAAGAVRWPNAGELRDQRIVVPPGLCRGHRSLDEGDLFAGDLSFRKNGGSGRSRWAFARSEKRRCERVPANRRENEIAPPDRARPPSTLIGVPRLPFAIPRAPRAPPL